MRRISLSKEDRAILQQIPALCDQLGIKRKNPKKLFWQDKIVGSRKTASVPVDYLYVDGRHVTLAKRLQGVLTLEEWKPLLGSSLLVKSWGEPRFRRALTGSLVIGVAYYVLALYLATQSTASILGTFSSGIRVFLIFPAFPISLTALLFWLFNRRSGPSTRHDLLSADLQVAETIGKDHFLAVLHKIDGASFDDDQRLIPRSFRSKQPSIKERIPYLEAPLDTTSVY